MQQEIFVHDEEGLYFEGRLESRHHFEKLVAGFEEIENSPLPPKKEDVVQKFHPIGQPTDGITVAEVAPSRSGRRTPRMRVSIPETISGCRWALRHPPQHIRASSECLRRARWCQHRECVQRPELHCCVRPPRFANGDNRRTMRHISETLPTFTMMEEMPTTSYCSATNSRANRSRVGKSSTAQGLEMFALENQHDAPGWNWSICPMRMPLGHA